MANGMTALGVIDVVEWQTTVDLRTGQPVEVDDPRVELAKALCRAHPYPGDLSDAAMRWVTDTALDVVRRYAPQFLFVDYADLYFPAVFRPTTDAQVAEHRRRLFDEVGRLLSETGYAPVVVGTGGLRPFGEYVDASDLDGLMVAGGMTVRLAGIYDASERDLRRMAAHPGVARVLSRETFREELGGCDEFYRRCAEHLMVAREGHVFRGVNTGARQLYRSPRLDDVVPLHTELGQAASLTDIPALVLSGLDERPVALIVVEGVGCDTFPWPHQEISNMHGWYHYTLGDGQYLAITTGQHFVEHHYPPGYRYELYDDEHKPFPYSGLFDELPATAIGRRTTLRSAAVGNRSTFTHICAGADIAIECFVRSLYNHGVMGVVQR